MVVLAGSRAGAGIAGGEDTIVMTFWKRKKEIQSTEESYRRGEVKWDTNLVHLEERSRHQ